MSGFSGRQWLLALAIATLIHGAAAFSLLRTPPSSGSVAAGLGGITVSLGPAGRAPGSAKTVPPPTTSEIIEPLEELSEIAPADPPTKRAPSEAIDETEAPSASEPIDAATARDVDPGISSEVEAQELDAVAARASVDKPSQEALVDARRIAPVEMIEPVDSVEVVPDRTARGDKAIELAESTDVPQDPPPPIAEVMTNEAADITLEDAGARSVDLAPVAEPVLPSPRKPLAPVKEGNEPTTTEPSADTAQIAGAGGRAGDQEDGNLGIGQAASGGGDVGMRSDYYATLQAWLERHKVYPRRALSRRLEGVVSLRFVMDREGRVLDYRIERSSGHRLLDNAVETLIERAQPLPTIPDDINETSLTLVVPISFVLN